MIAVTGYNTTICQKLRELSDEPMINLRHHPLPEHCSKFVLAQGIMHGQPMAVLSSVELMESLDVNFVGIVRFCDRILAENEYARIVVIGSQSAVNGSYNTMYAGMKAALHCYVRSKPISSTQRLVCLAPGIIADSGMTRRRHDYPEVLVLRPTCRAIDVARAAYDVLERPTISPVRVWPI